MYTVPAMYALRAMSTVSTKCALYAVCTNCVATGRRLYTYIYIYIMYTYIYREQEADRDRERQRERD